MAMVRSLVAGRAQFPWQSWSVDVAKEGTSLAFGIRARDVELQFFQGIYCATKLHINFESLRCANPIHGPTISAALRVVQSRAVGASMGGFDASRKSGVTQ